VIAGAAAEFYDGRTSRSTPAQVGLLQPSSLEVSMSGGSVHWPLEHPQLRWERNAQVLRITFDLEEPQVLLVRDKEFIREFVRHMQKAGRRGVYDRSVALAQRGILLFVLLVAALLIVGYFVVLPFAAERMALLLPRTFDEQLGAMAFQGFISDAPVDTASSQVVQRFADRLHLQQEGELRFHVVDQDEVNAFALPGGDIVVFQGIIDRISTPEQLAALLAHEAVHVQRRHSMRMMVRSLSGYLFLSLVVGDAGGVLAVLLENADALRNLGYSRALETEADRSGMEWMHRASVDPQGMIQLMEMLEGLDQGLPDELELLSSHPLTKERKKAAEEAASGLTPVPAQDPELTELFRQLKGRKS
jgi:beta-barrel assembly-enhancing protease